MEDLSNEDEQTLTLFYQVDDLYKMFSNAKILIQNCNNLTIRPFWNINITLAEQVCFFPKKYWNFSNKPGNFQACRFLGKSKNRLPAPNITVKFLYSGEKMNCCGRKLWLVSAINTHKRRSVYLNERIPPSACN